MRHRTLPLLLALALLLAAPLARAAQPSAEPVAPVAQPGAGAVAEQPPAEAPEGEGPPAPLSPVTLSIDARNPAPAVPRRFLGLSFEALAIPQLGRWGGHGDLVGLLRSLGPGSLRLGGITSDQNVGWTDPATPPPAWAGATLSPADFRRLGALARRSGWQVMLTVGMAHYEPQAAAREVAAAHAALGRSLAAVELGNEPDAYGKHGFRVLPWLAQGYEEQVAGYLEAINALTPGVKLAGPGVTGSGAFMEWGEAEALAERPAVLTGHHYPLGCVDSPTAAMLLNPELRAREARSLHIYTALGALRGIPVRIDETNSVSCGGVPGVSNTFAGALWAAGYILQAMDAGVVGLNFHGLPGSCSGYAPFCAATAAAQASGRLHAQPDWYALLFARSLVGTRPLRTGSSSKANMLAAAFSGPHGALQVALVDYEPPGSQPLVVRVPVSASVRRVAVLRLTAASPSASSGIRLGGRAVSADGSWAPPAHTEQARARAGVLTVTLTPSSAALVTVPATPATGTRGRSH